MSGGLRLVAHVIVAADFHQPDLAEFALAHDAVPCFHQVRCAAPLRADLYHAVVFARGGEHGLAFHHVHADRLLAVDMGAGLDGGDHRQRVPVVGRAHQDDIQIFLGEHGAVVAEGARLLVRCLAHGHHFRGFGEHAAIHVAERDHLHG